MKLMHLTEYLTIIQQARIRYEMVDTVSREVCSAELAIIIPFATSILSGITFIKSSPKI